MRKHNEGYALPFVLVVMTVLALVATSMMTLALRNLQNQRTSVERMQDRYTAEGAIEIVVARLSNEAELASFAGTSVEEAIKNKIDSICGEVYGEGSEDAVYVPDPEDAAQAIDEGTAAGFEYQFEIISTSGSVQITCELKLSGSISGSGPYTITAPEIEYISYEIATVEITEGGESDET